MEVTDQEISEAIQSLPSSSWKSNNTSINDVVQQLESKMGLNLSHKLDFIQAQIHHHHLLSTQQPPQHNDHLALPQPHNFIPCPPTASSPAFHGLVLPSSQSTDATLDKPQAVAAPTIMATDSVQSKGKRRGGPGGLNKLCGVSPQLQVIVGQPALPRTEQIVKQLWAYIRKNNLQDPNNKRKIICNDELRLVFETDCTDMFKMNKLLAKHIIPLEPTKQSRSKKQKVDVDVESGTKSNQSGPSVIVSEGLANFFGVGEREMLQSEIIRLIWEYIKVNNLEDPLNPMVILCDAKLQELFGCESISALGIPEVLGRHHIVRR
ncbi:SWIB domain-containing protein [Cephalotus follicularis]|uniref:SWIB domain-containing protein n=1 Tax=Cephalotus follicularis TaxID=3775 RepID=A0A1Q3D4Q9_CEPFO|nr:SWIB domain-containing protein [Cephalotus follicularis]